MNSFGDYVINKRHMRGRCEAVDDSARIVSARGYAWILRDPWLRRALIPGGILTSPYEVLDYHATLTLEDSDGMRATFARRQKVRFIHDGVAAILDHAWGDGVLVSDYENSAGRLEGSYKDGDRRHLVIGLKRRMGRGQTLAFHARRRTLAAFSTPSGRVGR